MKIVEYWTVWVSFIPMITIDCDPPFIAGIQDSEFVHVSDHSLATVTAKLNRLFGKVKYVEINTYWINRYTVDE